MARNEFSKKTQRQALERSGGQCEAVGVMYGQPQDLRCTASVEKLHQFDHVILDANSKDNSLLNCACVCIPCHNYKTRFHDTPMAAKTLRQQDMARSIRKPQSRPMAGTKASGIRKRMSGRVERW